jgi:hypothetical protein
VGTVVSRDALGMINRIRMEPGKFRKTIQQQLKMFDSAGTLLRDKEKGKVIFPKEGITSWKQANTLLKKQRKMGKLAWSDGLALAADDYCKGNSSLKERVERYGVVEGEVGESVGMGEGDGEDFVVKLYIDDGVENRENRKNLVQEKFR